MQPIEYQHDQQQSIESGAFPDIGVKVNDVISLPCPDTGVQWGSDSEFDWGHQEHVAQGEHWAMNAILECEPEHDELGDHPAVQDDCDEVLREGELHGLMGCDPACMQPQPHVVQQVPHISCPAVDLINHIRSFHTCNRFGARVPLTTNWNIQNLEDLLQGYSDSAVLEWMMYGWSISCDPCAPLPPMVLHNHEGTQDNISFVDRYLEEEIKLARFIGPFSEVPFQQPVAVSPINTRFKKNGCDLRIIIDMSYPASYR